MLPLLAGSFQVLINLSLIPMRYSPFTLYQVQLIGCKSVLEVSLNLGGICMIEKTGNLKMQNLMILT